MIEPARSPHGAIAALLVASLLLPAAAGRGVALAQDKSEEADITAAIARGSASLIAQQQNDGSWEEHVGFTAVAILALLPTSSRIHPGGADAAARGLAYLERWARPDGGIHQEEHPHYSTAVALLAFAASGDPKYRGRIATARDFPYGTRVKEDVYLPDEEVPEALRALGAAGIRIGKIQISAGLKVLLAGRDTETLDALRPFAKGVYLHQVVERRGGGLTRYLDLPEALSAAAEAPDEAREWRIHFHVPLFREELGRFLNTQDYLRALLAILRREPASPHLEVETYTLDVLPEEYRREHIVTAVAQELEWVIAHMAR